MIVVVAGKTVKGPIHVDITIPDVAQRPERAEPHRD